MTQSENRGQLQSFSIPHWDFTADEKRALAFLQPLSRDYPEIASWFSQKVVPGLRDRTRSLVSIERCGTVVAVGIAKKEADERKICTVRVSPEFSGRGFGVRLFDTLLRWVDTDRPHLTVSARKLPAFERIFDWYGFEMTSALTGRYLPGETEYAFNEFQVGDLPVLSSISHTAASSLKPSVTAATA